MEGKLFVPLNSKYFDDFKQKRKIYELRIYRGHFNEREVLQGRPVELRKGYSGQSLHGKIGKVFTGSLEEIFTLIDFKLVLPSTLSREIAIAECASMLGDREKYIAFEVLLN